MIGDDEFDRIPAEAFDPPCVDEVHRERSNEPERGGCDGRRASTKAVGYTRQEVGNRTRPQKPISAAATMRATRVRSAQAIWVSRRRSKGARSTCKKSLARAGQDIKGQRVRAAVVNAQSLGRQPGIQIDRAVDVARIPQRSRARPALQRSQSHDLQISDRPGAGCRADKRRSPRMVRTGSDTT